MLKIKTVAMASLLALVLTGCSSGNERLIDRPSPEIEVTAEEFEKEYGFSPSIPESVEEVQYIIDTDTHRGFVGFYEGDVLWNIKVLKTEGIRHHAEGVRFCPRRMSRLTRGSVRGRPWSTRPRRS